ncbi:hypothetical protein BJ170DRAFT_343348 [Xylariales sp. AK1849]|nr:hypothetical protein BJ170DRAFT_343348 [Xylariales sp. AK1849]
MSGDRPNSSFGDPNAQPPTPKQTPTSVVFPSPVFQTPKNDQGSFEDSSGWTPRFAEEYSVFNSTPGNLRGSQVTFVDFSISTPYQDSSSHKRLSAEGLEGIAAQLATHVNHLSPNPNLPLPPVTPSRRLPSAPGPQITTHSQSDRASSFGLQESSGKRSFQETVDGDQIQTATPPPSARKGARKLAPKIQTTMMQNEQNYGQEFVVGTPQQSNMQNFVTTPEMFGFPMSAPATAPVFTDSRAFWETDTGMSGIDMDFSAAGSNMFQTPGGHRPMSSLDWGRSNELFQESGVMPQQNQESKAPTKKERPLAPKPIHPNTELHSQDPSMFGASFMTHVGDPFGMMNQGGGVNPGLLFTRPPSSSMEPATFDPMIQVPLMQSMSQPVALQIPVEQSQHAELRHIASTKEIRATKNSDRASASSPIKPSGRPGLSRGFSENRGRKPVRKASLPTLAPAARPASQQGSGSRSMSHNLQRSGRISPLKSHQRLSSLSSIAESVTPTVRTSVKFTIDSHGRARAETTKVAVDGDEEPTPTAVRSRKEAKITSRSWGSSEDDESSEDEEPIIIPSRNTSFALPDPNKPSSSHPFQSSRGSISEQSSSSLGIYYNELSSSVNDPESEAETVLNEAENGRGDAASELRKVVEDRQKRTNVNTSRRFVSGPAHSTASTISPTSLTEPGLPTPSSSQGNSVRCVCNRAENPNNSDGFMVQCESCENWLHGRCTNISRRTIPSVYICAFCANTPNAHGLRGRQTKSKAGGAGRRSAMSPLAHKSFKSFR